LIRVRGTSASVGAGGATWMAGLALLGACTTAEYRRDADAEVSVILAEVNDRVLGDRESWVERPRPEAVAEDGADGAAAESKPGAPGEDPPPEPVPLDLETALAIAFDTGREYLTRREFAYLEGLSLTGVRFQFGPQLEAAVSALGSDAEDDVRTSSVGAVFRGRQILPSGGTFAVSAALDTSRTEGPYTSVFVDDGGTPADPTDDVTIVTDDPFNGRDHTSDFEVSLTQPLLRGAGYTVSHEPLTQAERDMVYEIRDFELFRQDFAIDIAADFFDLVNRSKVLANEERNFQDAIFDIEQSEALRQVGRNSYEDVFIARRRVISAENRVLVVRADYELALDSFRIRLGLPEGAELEIREEDPPFEAVRLDVESAVEVALHNRLDLITAREQLEDGQRAVRIAANGLLPQVDLTLAFGESGGDGRLTQARPDTWRRSAALSVEVPLQRTLERNDYRSAMISLDQQRRNYEQLLESVDRDVRNSLRQLRRLEQQIDLQREQIGQEQRAVAVTEIRYESGDAASRDLLDARQALIDAQNSLIDFQVDHFIARLGLYRDLGLLFIDPEGMWRS